MNKYEIINDVIYHCHYCGNQIHKIFNSYQVKDKKLYMCCVDCDANYQSDCYQESKRNKFIKEHNLSEEEIMLFDDPKIPRIKDINTYFLSKNRNKSLYHDPDITKRNNFMDKYKLSEKDMIVDEPQIPRIS